MKLIHYLLDTKNKRELLFVMLFFVLVCLETVNNMQFLWFVSKVGQLEELYNLIPIAANGMIGRVILSLFQAFPGSSITLLFAVLASFSLRFICILCFVAYFLYTKERNSIVLYTRKMTRILLSIICVSVAISAVYALLQLRMTTYQQVLDIAKLLSYFLLGSQSLVLLITLLALGHVFQLYRKALAYYAIEIQ